jgi:hypothetical protein
MDKNNSDLTFTEQAEYLDIDNILDYSAEHPKEDYLLKKLRGAGAQLITGPRGCGKTTLLLKAYILSVKKPKTNPFAVYVNFKHSLRLEPLYCESGRATYFFNSWLILKIYQGVFETLKKSSLEYTKFSFSETELNKAVEELELCQSNSSFFEVHENDININALSDHLEQIISTTKQKRVVLLLDDAGHAFSTSQQKDFFELFRKIRSKYVCPKAAIYPGITNLSSSFHIGHDAEEINIWLDPTESNYLPFMKSLLKIRLSDDLYNSLSSQEEIIDMICYAAFGIPRAMLNVIRAVSENNIENKRFNRVDIRNHIRDSYKNSLSIFTSLKDKMPSYKSFIEEGETVYNESLEHIKSYNKDKPSHLQSVSIAIKTTIEKEFEKLLNFYQYAGLIMYSTSISKGSKGNYLIYILNYSALIDKNALIGGAGINFGEYTEAFKKRPSQAYPYLTVRRLLHDKKVEECFALSLPSCHKCNHPRANTNAKFCENCGSQLSSKSIFEEIVQADISSLPITPNRAKTIKENTSIKTIKDILMDHDNRELRKTPQVGAYWTKRIKSYAEEYIA